MINRSKFTAGAIVLTGSLIFAASAIAEPSGNEIKGKYAYRGVYNKCQQRGEVQETKPILNPDTKTQAQWIRTFEEKDFEQFKCGQEWKALSDDERNNILTYLWKHAADSPEPAKCK